MVSKHAAFFPEVSHFDFLKAVAICSLDLAVSLVQGSKVSGGY